MKNKIKHILFGIVVSLSLTYSFAYTPTAKDTENLNNIKLQLVEIIGDNNRDLWDFYYQVKLLKNKYSFDDRLDYMLGDLYSFLWTKIQTQKQVAKMLSIHNKQKFVTLFSGDIQDNTPIDENCVGWYNTLDDIAFTHNFSLPILIATRYRETNCGYYLPSNSRGPFQITSKDYGTGEITEEIFVQAVIDFIDFAESKYARYEKANSLSGLRIDLSYTGISYTGIVRHGALYNGLSGYTVYGDAQPLNPNYVFDNYGLEYSGATRDGILSLAIKFLDWELRNK